LVHEWPEEAYVSGHVEVFIVTQTHPYTVGATRRTGRGVLVIALFLLACVGFVRQEERRLSALNVALASGELTLITRNAPQCYFWHRDQALGFEYELAKHLADELGVKLRVVVADRWTEMLDVLAAQPAAIIAADVAATPGRRRHAAFSRSYRRARHVALTAPGVPSLTETQMSGRTVYVPTGSAAQERLEEMAAQGAGLDLRLCDHTGGEELIRMVAAGAVPSTVVHEHVARLHRHLYPQARIGAAIGPEEAICWALRPDEPELLRRVDEFLERAQHSGLVEQLHQRYYADSDALASQDEEMFRTRLRTRLPDLRPLVEEAAQRHGFDWRLISALIYQESHFDPEALGPSGALGLMQLTPTTAAALGVRDPLDPRQNVEAGVRYLKDLQDGFTAAADGDRLLMALAAYNIGRRRVLEARELARAVHLDPQRWSSLEETLPHVSAPPLITDASAGPFDLGRGAATLAYIKRIQAYYDILRQRDLLAALAREQALDG
jgi:membrane-bound lytic murein transglycosylase F